MQIRVKEGSTNFVWFHRFLDFITPFLVLYFLNSVTEVPWYDRYIVIGVLGGVLLVTASQIIGVYQSWRARPLSRSSTLIFKAWSITWAIIIVLAFLYKDSQYFSRLSLTIWLILVPSILISYRIIIRKFLSLYSTHNKNIKKIALMGEGSAGDYLKSAFSKNKWLGYQIVGVYGQSGKTDLLGTFEDAIVDANKNKFNEIYICLPLEEEAQIKYLLNKLTDTHVIVKYVPDLFTFDLMHANWVDIQGMPVISVYDTPLSSNSSRLIKRASDISLSIIVIALSFPVMLITALGIKITSPGPILYTQSRISWNGSPFKIYKFRSMPVNTEKSVVYWGQETKKTNTKFGSFIRKTHLDELPQFFNVLKGDMSIVGPRPERDIFVKQFSKEIPRYMQKHMVKAGITGWAQINGLKGDTCLEKRIEHDLHYIKSWSLGLDIKIILLTILKILRP